MPRRHIWYFLRDLEGRPISNAKLSLYNAGTKDLATIYDIPVSIAASAANDEIDQSAWYTDSSGFFDFYIGDYIETLPNVGYASDTLFDLQWSSPTSTPPASGVLHEKTLFPLLFPVDETDPYDQNDDKLISNQMAYDIENHIPLQYYQLAHDLEPVDPRDPGDATYNKLVSDSFMKNALDDLETLVLCGGSQSISVAGSGALVDQVSVISWSPSANGTYWADFNHALLRTKMFPVVQVYDVQSRDQIIPANIKDINTSTIRIWLATDTIDVAATIVGQVVPGSLPLKDIRFFSVWRNDYNNDHFTVNYIKFLIDTGAPSGSWIDYTDYNYWTAISTTTWSVDHWVSPESDSREVLLSPGSWAANLYPTKMKVSVTVPYADLYTFALMDRDQYHILVVDPNDPVEVGQPKIENLGPGTYVVEYFCKYNEPL